MTPYVKSHYYFQHVCIFEWLTIFSKTERIRKEEDLTYFKVLRRNSTRRTDDILTEPFKPRGICIYTTCSEIQEPCVLPTQLDLYLSYDYHKNQRLFL
jgi:hypothetical protein